MQTGKRNILLGYPNSGKSTLAHILYHSWEILRNRELVLMGEDDVKVFISGSQNQQKASAMTRSIKAILLSKPVEELFGQIIDQHCADSYFKLLGMPYSAEKEYHVESFGMDSGTITSKHADFLTLDDIVTRDNATSPHERERLVEKLDFDIRRALNPGATLNIIGNLHHSSDFYCMLMDEQRYPEFKNRVIKVVMLDDTTQQSTWKERWSTEEVLEIKRNAGQIRWELLWQQNPKLMTGGIVWWNWIQWWTGNPDHVKPPNLPVYIGIDCAIKQKEHSDYFALGVYAFDASTRYRYEEDMFWGRLSWDDRLKKIIEVVKMYRHRLAGIAVEDQGGGFDIGEILGKQTDLHITTISTSKDKISRLTLKQHLWQQGRIWLRGPDRPWDVMPGVGTWPEELVSFRADVAPPPPNHDDRTDTWLLAEEIIPDGVGKLVLLTANERTYSGDLIRESARMVEGY